jgi:hypothetical protein
VFKSKLFGPKSDFPNDPFLVDGAEVREVSSVMYMGYVNIVFNIFQRNFGRFGYKTG